MGKFTRENSNDSEGALLRHTLVFLIVIDFIQSLHMHNYKVLSVLLVL